VRNFYVSTTGSDSADGSAGSPWLTIQKADTTQRQPGDCVNVAPGVYQQKVLITHGGSSPTPTGYVVYRCQQLDACHILAAGGGHLWGLSGNGSFVVIDGFELDGNNALQQDGIADNCLATDDATYGVGNNSYQAGLSVHHLWAINNIAHHCNLAGILMNNKEWFYTIHNTVYHNAWTSGYQGSGIGYVVVQCIEAGGPNCYTSGVPGTPTSDWNYTPFGNDVAFRPPSAYYPFHNVVAWNVVYNNRISQDSGSQNKCSYHTDGNGIIMDTFLDNFTNTLTYPFQTLVMGNVSFYNGGCGVHVFRSSNVTVANNTVYNNNTDGCLDADAWVIGDLSQQGGANNVWVNNVGKTVQQFTNNLCTLIAGNGAAVADSNNTYGNNVLSVNPVSPHLGSNRPCLFNNDVSYFTCSNNQCGIDPGFANASPGTPGASNGQPSSGTWTPGASNFAITSGPGVGHGRVLSFLPPQAVDAGACYHTLTTCVGSVTKY
jgi:parallel beta-helix repeat protein